MLTELHLAALACYGLTGALVAVPLLRLPGGTPRGAPAVAAASAAVGLHFAALLAYARTAGALPLSGVAPALSSLGFLVGLLGLLVLWLTREGAIALVAAPLVMVLLVAALGTGFGPVPPGAAPGGPWFVLHVGASLLGLALIAVAFAASALYLLQHRELKARRFGAVFRVFPPLEQLDRINYIALILGFPTLTLGVVLGAGYVGLEVGMRRIGAAHLGVGLGAWVVLGAMVALRLAGWLRGRRAALGSIAGFAVIAASYTTLVLLQHGFRRFL
ncbi:MAG: cytochrome c biogenesis protein CcsA [Gemmatimonadetes bacterium]|nr:cytochrome c biogenesis protein CcsA [Gemmatimonadota bacterium]